MNCNCLKCRHNGTHVSSDHVCGVCNVRGHGQIEHSKGPDYIYQFMEATKNDILPENKWCNINGCSRRKTHSTDSHHCLCGARHSDYDCPNRKNDYSCIICPLCRAKNELYDIESYNKGLNDKPEDCCICLDSKKLVYFPVCHHCVCNECLDKLKPDDKDDVVLPNNEKIAARLGEKKLGSLDGKCYTTVYAGMGCYWIVRRDYKEDKVSVRFVHTDDIYDQKLYEGHYIFINGYKEV